MFELPFVANKSAVANAQAVQALYETQLRDEFKEVQPICVWAHDQGVIHTNEAGQPCSRPEGSEVAGADQALEPRR